MKLVASKKDWNEFVQDNGPRSGSFLQSWEWGELQRGLGNEVLRYDSGDARAQLIEMRLPAGQQYHYIPRGPIGTSPQACLYFTKLIVDEIGRDLFIRVDLARTLSAAEARLKILEVKDVQPATTLITDLSVGEAQLFEKMHSKTRYNIRLAEKKGVEIKIDAKDALNVFVNLVTETSARHGIRSHKRSHYEAILEYLDGSDDSPRAFIATAFHDGDTLAAAMCIDWNGTRTYLHGASSDLKKNLMSPHLLHWKLIDDAKRNGIRSYDWWGIAPEGVDEHPLRGVTRFKKGFGGEIVTSPGTIDVVLKPMMYTLYNFAKKFR
ncbi:peptidoglycan bridge formation glycyltransferase FemA/FemB family protein [Candidatus Uhrbacteria bacterium]|jgi:lipid II:glycine glycyltransferase (peptidoglycan interpeptide bridge formation enzyme)|nr:peptidoglycan bridge formation glycyltransferase FemA/FemB family protein [Candidatus Uhrbacteria bacterium]